MASIALGIVGGVIGGIAGGPGGAALGWSIGTVVGGLLFPPHMDGGDRGRLDDLRVTGSTYATMIPRVWGTMRLGGNIIWATDLVEHSSSESVGGKGGGGSVTNYTYTVSMAVAVCRGPITKVTKIMGDTDVIYDETAGALPPNVRVYLGDEAQIRDTYMQGVLVAAGKACPAHRGVAYVVFQDFDLSKWGNRIPNLNFEVVAPNATVGGVLADVFADAGLSAGEYDVLAATAVVTGFAQGSVQTAKQVVEPLVLYAAADLVEVDGKVVYVPRGGAAAASLPWDELGAGPYGRSADPVRVSSTRGQEFELPSRVTVEYYTYDADPAKRTMEQGVQGAIRFAKQQLKGVETFSFPMAMTDDEARRLAERLLYQRWAERNVHKTPVLPKWMWLAPGDVLTLPVAGGTDGTPAMTARCRVVSMELAPFGEVGLVLAQDSASVLTQVVSGGTTTDDANSGVSGGVLASRAWSGNALLDAHAQESAPGLYLAACGAQGWGGCTVWLSRDGGLSWQHIETISEYTPMGRVVSPPLPPATGEAVFDAVNYVDVVMYRGVPQSVGYWDVIGGANAVLVGDEVVQFMTATLLDSATSKYRLSNLLRGLRGTDYVYRA